MKTVFAKIVLFFALCTASVEASEPIRLIYHKDPQGYLIELDDRSIWKVTDSSVPDAKYFSAGDPIVIHPIIFPFFYSAKYYFVNQKNGATVNVDLSLGPVVGSEVSVIIEDIDYTYGRLWLIDGRGARSLWQIEGDKIVDFQKWLRGQSIILGSNKSYNRLIGSKYRYILINVERNSHAAAEIMS